MTIGADSAEYGEILKARGSNKGEHHINIGCTKAFAEEVQIAAIRAKLTVREWMIAAALEKLKGGA